MAQHRHMRPARGAKRGVAILTEQGKGWAAGHGGEVRGAGIIAEAKIGAARQGSDLSEAGLPRQVPRAGGGAGGDHTGRPAGPDPAPGGRRAPCRTGTG